MNDKKQKGMWKRTIGLFCNIRIPWLLYIIQIILGIISAKVVLLYIPYQTALRQGNINKPGLIWSYVGLMLLSVGMNIVERIPSFYSSAIITRNLQNKLINRSVRLPLRSFEKNGSRIVSLRRTAVMRTDL